MHRLIAVVTTVLLALTACSAPATTPGPATPPTVSTSPTPASPPAASKRIVVDTSCRTDADCTVKDVGNCCGYYPACVNVNSPTDPKGVQASCTARGMMSVCGFPAISGCSCVAGQCTSQSDGGNGNTLNRPLTELPEATR